MRVVRFIGEKKLKQTLENYLESHSDIVPRLQTMGVLAGFRPKSLPEDKMSEVLLVLHNSKKWSKGADEFISRKLRKTILPKEIMGDKDNSVSHPEEELDAIKNCSTDKDTKLSLASFLGLNPDPSWIQSLDEQKVETSLPSEDVKEKGSVGEDKELEGELQEKETELAQANDKCEKTENELKALKKEYSEVLKKLEVLSKGTLSLPKDYSAAYDENLANKEITEGISKLRENVRYSNWEDAKSSLVSLYIMFSLKEND